MRFFIHFLIGRVHYDRDATAGSPDRPRLQAYSSARTRTPHERSRTGCLVRLAANPGYRLDAMNFWARRFARIYPVLFAALLLTFALDWISYQLPPVNHKLREIGLHSFLVNLFSLQGVAGKTYGSNGALWTLSLEVQFYAVYPLLFALRRRIGMTQVLALVAAINVVSGYVLERHDLQFFTSYWLSWTLGAWIAEAKASAGTGDARAS